MLEANAAIERDRGVVEVVDVERERRRYFEQTIGKIAASDAVARP